MWTRGGRTERDREINVQTVKLNVAFFSLSFSDYIIITTHVWLNFFNDYGEVQMLQCSLIQIHHVGQV